MWFILCAFKFVCLKHWIDFGQTISYFMLLSSRLGTQINGYMVQIRIWAFNFTFCHLNSCDGRYKRLQAFSISFSSDRFSQYSIQFRNMYLKISKSECVFNFFICNFIIMKILHLLYSQSLLSSSSSDDHDDHSV